MHPLHRTALCLVLAVACASTGYFYGVRRGSTDVARSATGNETRKAFGVLEHALAISAASDSQVVKDHSRGLVRGALSTLSLMRDPRFPHECTARERKLLVDAAARDFSMSEDKKLGLDRILSSGLEYCGR